MSKFSYQNALPSWSTLSRTATASLATADGVDKAAAAAAAAAPEDMAKFQTCETKKKLERTFYFCCYYANFYYLNVLHTDTEFISLLKILEKSKHLVLQLSMIVVTRSADFIGKIIELAAICRQSLDERP